VLDADARQCETIVDCGGKAGEAALYCVNELCVGGDGGGASSAGDWSCLGALNIFPPN
jgi:hypothetical protein